MSKTSEQTTESFEFQAEVRQLLDILIHSVYTAKDIFIRELVSNAADALEKVRFLKVQGNSIADVDAALEIRIECKPGDSEEAPKKLVITDTGIGLTADEAKTNLGTIAHSGATAFLEQLKSLQGADDLSLIGRFGVGFYSVFMVADRVVVKSRSVEPDATPIIWESDGHGSFSVRSTDESLPRGTSIEIELKKDEGRFAVAESIEEAIRKYSNFVAFPVYVGEKQVNQTTAVWREQPHQVKAEQYDEFYKFLSYDTEAPLLRQHLSVDVPLQFSALLFVPKTSSEMIGFGQGEVSLQLYVKRILIDGENKELLPKYLRFVRGVVESEDLPLNVSRETLQENPLVAKIRDTLTKKLLSQLSDLAKEDDEKYAEFWHAFGRILKEGYSDFAHREALHELWRFNSSHGDDDKSLCSLADYVERMPEKQDAIYYLTGNSRAALERDPRLELFRSKGIEVLYLYDVADEFVLGSVGRYEEKELKSAEHVSPEELREVQAAADGQKSEDAPEPAPEADTSKLIARFKEILGEKVKEVRKSDRLVDSPACLVSDDVSGHMEKVFRLINKDESLPVRTLEINARHPLIAHLQTLVSRDAEDPFVTQACEQLFEGAMLMDGYLSDPHELVERMHAILSEAAALKQGEN